MAPPNYFTVMHPTISASIVRPPAPITEIQAGNTVETSPLTAFPGIGPLRANQLHEAGMELLAAASPESVAAAVEGPGMNLDIAKDFIDQAKKLQTGEP